MEQRYPFPKFDLHLHLDGAIDPHTMLELAEERGIDHGAKDFEEFCTLCQVPKDCHSVNDFLARFALPTKILQDKASLARIAKELVLRSAEQGLSYIEMRFAPQLHTAGGLTQSEATEAVIAGIEEGKKEAPGIGVGLIACCMVIGPAHLNKEANIETVHVVNEYLGKGVCAIDLAGAEGVAPFEDFTYVFELADKFRLPRTCHAGDSQPPEYVHTAVTKFGSKRIGHGHHVYFDKDLCRTLSEMGIFLEICLTSNVQCETEPSYEEHPAKKLLDMGFGVTLNTDNPMISVTSIEEEYDHAIEKCGFTVLDLVQCSINSVNASFMPNADKEVLIKELHRWQDYYKAEAAK